MEPGSVRYKIKMVICVKRIGSHAIAGLTYYIVSCNYVYNDVGGGFIGALECFFGPWANEAALLSGTGDTAALVFANNYAAT